MYARVLCMAQGFPCVVDVLCQRANEACHSCLPKFFCDRADGVEVRLRGGGDARLDDMHAEGFELARHVDLLFGVHAATRGLLAVAQCGVKQLNLSHDRFLKRRSYWTTAPSEAEETIRA